MRLPTLAPSGPAVQLRHLARRSPASGVPAATRSAYSTADKAAGPDPKTILNSIGEVVYDWDIGGDRLTWGPNVTDVLGFISPEELATGRGYGTLLGASNTNRATTRSLDPKVSIRVAAFPTTPV